MLDLAIPVSLTFFPIMGLTLFRARRISLDIASKGASPKKRLLLQNVQQKFLLIHETKI